MALEFGFYNSLNGDRKYNASQMSEIFEGIITDGVYAGVGEIFATTPGVGLQVLIGTGRAWFNYTWNKNRAKYIIDLDIPDPVFSRIDTICIKVDRSSGVRANSFTVVKGSISTTPEPFPLPTNDPDVFYHPISYVTVRPLATQIASKDIQILVGTSKCPFVTSILQQTDIDVLFANWEDQFMTWWQGIKETLSGDVVGNILNDIDDLDTRLKTLNNTTLKTDGAATSDEILAGISTSAKWASGLAVQTVVQHLLSTLPGIGIDNSTMIFAMESGTIVAPVSGRAFVICCGGGGSGGGGRGWPTIQNISSADSGYGGGGGGGSGYVTSGWVTLIAGKTYTITVGKSGGWATLPLNVNGLPAIITSTASRDGVDGEASSFDTIVADGGKGGKGPTIDSSTYMPTGGYGGDGFCGGGGGAGFYTKTSGSNTTTAASNGTGGKGSIITINGISISGENGSTGSGGLPNEATNAYNGGRASGQGGSSILGNRHPISIDAIRYVDAQSARIDFRDTTSTDSTYGYRNMTSGDRNYFIDTTGGEGGSGIFGFGAFGYDFFSSLPSNAPGKATGFGSGGAGGCYLDGAIMYPNAGTYGDPYTGTGTYAGAWNRSYLRGLPGTDGFVLIFMPTKKA